MAVSPPFTTPTRAADPGRATSVAIEALTEVTRALTSASTVGEAVRRTLASALPVTQAEGAALLLAEAEGRLRVVDTERMPEVVRAGLEAEPLSRAVAGGRWLAFHPLVARGVTLGALALLHGATPPRESVEAAAAASLAAQAALAIDRLRTLEALRESEGRARSVIDHLKQAVFQTDAAGKWLFLNPAWEEITGFSVAESLGVEFVEYVHPDDRARNWSLFEPLIRREKDYCRHQVRYLTKAGGFRWIEVFARLTLAPDDSIVGTSGTLLDITEQRATAEALREAEARLQESQRLESLGRLAGGIAHDFNNLLMGVLGNATVAIEELPPNAAAREPLEDVVVAARRAADLTRQLLAYAGKGKFVVQPLDVSRLVLESTGLLMTAVSKRATVHHEHAEALPLVDGDATQVRQVVMNLLTNASDALGDQHGVITVRTALVTADREKLARAVVGADLEPGSYVSLTVTDTGSGMNEETRTRIFEPFFSTKFTGRGLGLPAVLGIVRGHRGALLVASEPGSGTTVEVLLPPSKAVRGTPTPEPPPVQARERAHAVLVVDDEEMVRKVTRHLLERMGCEVMEAHNGLRALEQLDAHRANVDLVLLDLTMPELSGEETLARIRARWPELPVVLMSGFTSEAVGSEANEFLGKPFGPKELRAVLERSLDATTLARLTHSRGH